jgi:hypothetical protein
MAFLLVFTTFATTIIEYMKILVCISKVPDTTAKIAFSSPNVYDENGVTFIINPYDEWYALVRALELKETLGGTVTVVSVGGADYEPIIRKALAIGADEGVRIDASESDAFGVSKEIAEYAKGQSFDLILWSCARNDRRNASFALCFRRVQVVCKWEQCSFRKRNSFWYRSISLCIAYGSVGCQGYGGAAHSQYAWHYGGKNQAVECCSFLRSSSKDECCKI